MGGDGGTIATRRDFIVKKKKSSDAPPSRDKDLDKDRWRHCALSGAPLKEPVVLDELGNLMNKENLIRIILKGPLEAPFTHIKRLKDVEQILPTPSDGKAVPFHCPITSLDADGSHAFVVLTKCSHLISEQAIKEIGAPKCPQCDVAFDFDADAIFVIPNTPEHVAHNSKRAAARRAAQPLKGKSKREGAEEPAPKRVKGGVDRASVAIVTKAAAQHDEAKRKDVIYASMFNEK